MKPKETVMEPGSKLNVLNLFKKPNKWTSEQLTGLNIEQQNNTDITSLVAEVVLQENGDSLYETLADRFSLPTRHEIVSGRIGSETAPGIRDPLLASLNAILNATNAFESGHSVLSELNSIADDFIASSRTRFLSHTYSFSPIPFDLSSLHIQGSLGQVGTYLPRTEDRLPLTIFVGKKRPEHICSLEEIVPYLLFQAILKYEREPTLDTHTTFVVSMKGANLQFNKAIISREYLTDLIEHKAPRDYLRLYRSSLLDLLEQDDRRKCVRGFLGLIQTVHDQFKQYKIKEP